MSDTEELLAQHLKIERLLWDSFNEKPMGYNIIDYTKCDWWTYPESGQVYDIGWMLDGNAYSGEVYGSMYWENDTHAISVMYDGCGNKDACVFNKSRRLDEEPDDR